MNRFVVAEPLWCTGCNTCLAACSDVHKTQGLQQHPRLALAKTSTITAPVVCHHCEEAPCLQVCPVNAISQRDDAIQLNESLCIGCKLCAVVCPFGAISASGSRPVNAHAQYVFQAEGSLKNGEENVLPQHVNRPGILETKLPEKEVNRMTKNTRFSPRSVNGQFVWFWKVRANMTHNGRQFVPLPQRLAVHQRLCVCGFVSMSGIPGVVMVDSPPLNVSV